MSQPDISYEDLTKDYPRYPDVFDITTLSDIPEDALVVSSTIDKNEEVLHDFFSTWSTLEHNLDL